MSEAKDHYVTALRARQAGEACPVDSTQTLNEVKPWFYADSKLLIDDVLKNLKLFKDLYPPYGLSNVRGNAIEGLADTPDPWRLLEGGLANMVRQAFRITEVPTDDCPYHELLAKKLGGRALGNENPDRADTNTLHSKVAPGGIFAPATIVPMLSRIPAMKRVHGAQSDVEKLARSSSGLLNEPLAHNQHAARPFVFTLTGRVIGNTALPLISFDRSQFFPDEMIRDYTKLTSDISGNERIDWAVPTSTLKTTVDLRVGSRVIGSEIEYIEGSETAYPAGTTLGEIIADSDEDTIGCPGRVVAYWLWNTAIDVISQENMWDITPKPPRI